MAIMPGSAAHYARAVTAGLAYLLLPVTGLVAYLTGREPRTRFHGLQAIVLGLLWPVALYAIGLGPAVAVQVTFAVGFLTWLWFLILTMLGRDPRLPLVARLLERLAATRIRGAPRSTSGN